MVPRKKGVITQAISVQHLLAIPLKTMRRERDLPKEQGTEKAGVTVELVFGAVGREVPSPLEASPNAPYEGSHKSRSAVSRHSLPTPK